MSKQEVASHTMDAHLATWNGFVKGAVGLGIMCGFILVALCEFAFGTSYTFLIGFGGLIAGLVAVIIDARARSTKWILSGGLLIVYGLFVAATLA